MVVSDGDKILIVKLGSIGDVVHTLPVVEIFKKSFPESKISWLVEKKSYQIIKDNPFIENIYLFDRSVKGFFELIGKIRKEKFKWAIDFQGTYKSQLFSLFSSAKYRVGYNQVREKIPFIYNISINLKTMDKHAVDRNIDLLKSISETKFDDINFNINILDKEKQNVRGLFKSSNIKKDYCLISALAGKPANRWIPQYFSKLADLIAKEMELYVIFLGGENDKDFNQEIILNCKEKRIFNLAGILSLKETSYVLSNAKFLVCGDTGPMHMAVAMGCPVVALFGGSNSTRTGPYKGNNIVIQHKKGCGPCYNKHCSNNHCLQEISVAEVFEACKHYR